MYQKVPILVYYSGAKTTASEASRSTSFEHKLWLERAGHEREQDDRHAQWTSEDTAGSRNLQPPGSNGSQERTRVVR